MDDTTMQMGLLMEAAQTQQKAADLSLARLEAHTRGLDTVVRSAVRHALIEELSPLRQEVERACARLREAQRSARWNAALAIGLSTLAVIGSCILLLRFLAS